MPSAWIELCMGDAATHAEAAAAYERLAEYVAASHAALGLPSADLGELDEEQLALAAEMYESDPAATVKGACSMVKPEPLALGRLVVSLDDKAAPKACANFLALCEGGSKGKASGKQLHYKGVPCHRIVKGFVCQGGDVVNGDGSGGDSIYGKKFNDEKPAMKKKHDRAGLVGCANSGKNTNSSGFYVTLAPSPQCDGKHVVFGEVTEGLDVLERIDAEAASESGEPRVPVFIGDCGVISAK
uniref:Peptidyl-prolyl cis-trans isomerase n=1 Tax=Prasinoderma coloniale TaxID=156133 RepID=A0A7R9TH34_9VIRI|eukprot:PRCOL_00000305-RA